MPFLSMFKESGHGISLFILTDGQGFFGGVNSPKEKISSHLRGRSIIMIYSSLDDVGSIWRAIRGEHYHFLLQLFIMIELD